MAVENFGPITFTNNLSYSGGFGKSLSGTSMNMKESQLTTNSTSNITDRNILLVGIEEVTYTVGLNYDNRKWDSRSRTYYPVFNYIFIPKIVKYENGLTLNIDYDNSQNTYTLESNSGSSLSFSEYGEVNTGSSIALKNNSKLSLQPKKSNVSDEFNLIYFDGTIYTGSLQSFDRSNLSLPAIISHLSELEALDASDFKPRNGKIIYGIPDGIAQDEFVNGEKRSVIEARRKREQEDEAKEIAAKEMKKEAQEKAEYNGWVRRYGQKAADAIKDRTPYIGMPEKAFRNISGYSLREENSSHRVYVNYGRWYGQPIATHYDADAIYCIVVCSGGKVVRITKP